MQPVAFGAPAQRVLGEAVHGAEAARRSRVVHTRRKGAALLQRPAAGRVHAAVHGVGQVVAGSRLGRAHRTSPGAAAPAGGRAGAGASP